MHGYRPAVRERGGVEVRTGPVVGLVAVGGAAGSVARVALSESIGRAGDSFPWATFVANVAGAFLLGLLVTALVERDPPSWRVRALVGTGGLGAFTTFSALAVETDLLVRADRPALAAVYLLATLAVGTAAAAIGARLATAVGPLRRSA